MYSGDHGLIPQPSPTSALVRNSSDVELTSGAHILSNFGVIHASTVTIIAILPVVVWCTVLAW